MKQYIRNNMFPLIALAGSFVAFVSYAVTRYDYDFGWHLAGGRYILAHGVPHHDIFSYTAAGFDWINHEWLNDVLWALTYQLGGYWLLAVSIAALWMLALWLAGRRTGWWVILLAASALLPYSGVRTAVWPVLFIVVIQRLLAGRRQLMWAIPAVMLLWANLHGSFFLGLVLLAWPLFRRGRDGRLVWLLTLLATFVNPYGWRLYVEVFRTIFDSHLHFVILEWRPLYYLVGTAVYLIVIVSLFWLYESKKLQLVLSWQALFLAMGLSSSRYITLFVVTTMSKLDEYGRLLADQVSSRFGGNGVRMLAAMAILAATIPYLQLMHFENGIRARTVDFPVAGANYLREHPCSGNLFNNYEQGGYLVWQLGIQDYIDGRMPSWRDEQRKLYVDQYAAFMDDAAARASQVRQYNIHCAIIEPRYARVGGQKRFGLAPAMLHEGWHEVVRDSGGILLER